MAGYYRCKFCGDVHITKKEAEQHKLKCSFDYETIVEDTDVTED